MALPMPFDNPSTYPGHVGIDFAQPKGRQLELVAKGVLLKYLLVTLVAGVFGLNTTTEQ